MKSELMGRVLVVLFFFQVRKPEQFCRVKALEKRDFEDR